MKDAMFWLTWHPQSRSSASFGNSKCFGRVELALSLVSLIPLFTSKFGAWYSHNKQLTRPLTLNGISSVQTFVFFIFVLLGPLVVLFNKPPEREACWSDMN